MDKRWLTYEEAKELVEYKRKRTIELLENPPIKFSSGVLKNILNHIFSPEYNRKDKCSEDSVFLLEDLENNKIRKYEK